VPLDIVVRAGCTVAEEVFGRSRSGLAEDLDLNKYRKRLRIRIRTTEGLQRRD
jgi:hypothetical protein